MHARPDSDQLGIMNNLCLGHEGLSSTTTLQGKWTLPKSIVDVYYRERMSFANDIFLIQYSCWDHWRLVSENFQSLEWLCPDKKWLYYRKKIFLTGKENNMKAPGIWKQQDWGTNAHRKRKTKSKALKVCIWTIFPLIEILSFLSCFVEIFAYQCQCILNTR